MMRWTATLVSAVVLVFSLTFAVARRGATAAPAAQPLAAAPARAGVPLRVRTLRAVPPLPRLRPADAPPAATKAAATTTTAAAAPAPSVARPPAPADALRPGPRLCARAAWAQPTGGTPALPATARC
jgi:hypothetical protein